MRQAWRDAARVVLALVLPLAVVAQPPEFSLLDKLEAKASDHVNITLDGALVRLGMGFMSDSDPDQRRVKELTRNLKGIYVRSFEFDAPGQYDRSDLEPFRRRLQGPGWSRIMDVKSRKKGEDVEIYVQTESGKVAGLAIIALEPQELTVISISGPINLETLTELGGQFGIPEVEKRNVAPPKPGRREDEE